MDSVVVSSAVLSKSGGGRRCGSGGYWRVLVGGFDYIRWSKWVGFQRYRIGFVVGFGLFVMLSELLPIYWQGAFYWLKRKHWERGEEDK